MAAALLTVVGAAIVPLERDALVALYNATNGPLWLGVSGWHSHASGGDPCGSWTGVACSLDGLHVT